MQRIAQTENRSAESVVLDAVQEYWIRFAGRNMLTHGEW